MPHTDVKSQALPPLSCPSFLPTAASLSLNGKGKWREENGLFSSAPTASPARVRETCSVAQSFNILRSEMFYSTRGTRKGCSVCREEWSQRKVCRS